MLNAILCTTINVPTFLEPLCSNIKKFYHNKNTIILIIGDMKTPTEAKSYCKKISKKFKIEIIYFGIEEQNKFFQNKKYRSLYKIFPKNDAIRRLLGNIYLSSYNLERFIYIDDDNYICDKNNDFISSHSIVGKTITTKCAYSKNKWPNLYKYIKTDEKMPIFPRGYPWNFRNINSFNVKFSREIRGKVISNCGFILGDPDIDASSRIFWKIDVKKIKYKNNIFLKPGNYFPFNDQNTSISGEYLNYYFKPLSAGRNSDIWTSYIFCKIAEINKDFISYGNPHLYQDRNIHDNWKDYEFEKMHNYSTDNFIEILRKVKNKRFDNNFDLFFYVINEMLTLTRIQIKSNINIKINDSKHYQGFSNLDRIKRNKINLKYIESYLIGYLEWLKVVRAIN